MAKFKKDNLFNIDMRMIVSSKEDPASENILQNVLDQDDKDWKKVGEWKNNPVYRHDDDYIASLNEHHIYVDDIDKELEELLDIDIELIIYISKHASKAGVHSLTVHPIGNFGEAKFGGKEDKLAPPAPHQMTAALRTLDKKAKEHGLKDEYEVSLEATHHGPYLETPVFYIEIGSDEDCWNDERAGEVIAETVMEYDDNIKSKAPTLVCIGGGHYAPRFTSLAKNKAVSIGHMVPGWAMRDLTQDKLKDAIELSHARYLYFDRSDTSGNERDRMKKWVEDTDVEVVRSHDLEDL